METITRIQIKTKPNLGKRIAAGFIDYGITIFFMIAMFYFYAERIENSYVLRGFPMWMIPIFWTFITIGCEQILGASPGNYLSDLKPISIQSFTQQKPSISQSIKRHVLDIVDLSCFGLIGLLLIKSTEHNQRLGDIWAKTIVIDIQDEEQGIF